MTTPGESDQPPDRMEPCPDDCTINYPHAHMIEPDGDRYIEDVEL